MGPANRRRQGYGESRRSAFGAKAEAGHDVLIGPNPTNRTNPTNITNPRTL